MLIPRNLTYHLMGEIVLNAHCSYTTQVLSWCVCFLCVLVTGPEFQRIRVGVGHRLDAFSSGVLGMISRDDYMRNLFQTVLYLIRISFSHLFLTLVLAVGNGNRALNDLYRTRVTRVIYHFCWFYIRCAKIQHTQFNAVCYVLGLHTGG